MEFHAQCREDASIYTYLNGSFIAMVYLPQSRGTTELHPDKTPGWNEVHFVNREEFATMAPTVLQLEVSRLTKLLPEFDLGSDTYNSIIAARRKVESLQFSIKNEMNPDEVESCAADLESSIMCVSAADSDADADSSRVLVYVADRLVYILGQLRHLY